MCEAGWDRAHWCRWNSSLNADCPVLEGGVVLERAAVNLSHTLGPKLPSAATTRLARSSSTARAGDARAERSR